MNNLRSRGTRAQTQIKEHQTKNIRRTQKGKKGKLGIGRESNKYKSQKLQSINDGSNKVTSKSKQMTTTKLAKLI